MNTVLVVRFPNGRNILSAGLYGTRLLVWAFGFKAITLMVPR